MRRGCEALGEMLIGRVRVDWDGKVGEDGEVDAVMCEEVPMFG